MKGARLIQLSMLMVSSLGTTSAHSQQEDCSKFIVQDQYSVQSDSQAYFRAQDVLCRQQFSQKSDAFSAGISGGIPIPVLDDVFSLDFNGHTSNNSFSEWFDSYCHSSYTEASSRLRHSSIGTYWSQHAADAVQACLANRNDGVFAYAVISKDGTRITTHFRVVGHEKLKHATILTPDAITGCDAKDPMRLGVFYQYVRDYDISGETREFGCGWDHTKTAQIELAFANQGTRVATIDSIKPAPPAPPAPEITYVWVPSPETYSMDGISGNGDAMSAAWHLCSDPAKKKDADWVIPDSDDAVSFYLTGDRTACGSYSRCELASKTSKEVCYDFYLQGHNESKPGTRHSAGHLFVNWKHRVPVKSLESAGSAK